MTSFRKTLPAPDQETGSRNDFSYHVSDDVTRISPHLMDYDLGDILALAKIRDCGMACYI